MRFKQIDLVTGVIVVLRLSGDHELLTLSVIGNRLALRPNVVSLEDWLVEVYL